MSIIEWFKKKKKEKEDLENIKTTISVLRKTIEELPPPVKVPTKFDIFLQTIEMVVKK